MELQKSSRMSSFTEVETVQPVPSFEVSLAGSQKSRKSIQERNPQREDPVVLSTSTSKQIPPVVEKQRKHSSQINCSLVEGHATSRSSSLHGSKRSTSGYHPNNTLPMPDELHFESWWQEAKETSKVIVRYNTSTKECKASLHLTLGVRAVVPSGAPLEPWDWHVGARMKLLGKPLTLRSASSETINWLDQQADAFLSEIYMLEQEVMKFRPVVPEALRGNLPRVCEPMGVRTWPQPRGGRLCLRRLMVVLADLRAALRQHRRHMPELIDSPALPKLQGPSTWSRERLLAEESMKHMSEVEGSVEDESISQVDLLSWLDGIALASSAAMLPETSTISSEDSVDGETADRARHAANVARTTTNTLSLQPDFMRARLGADPSSSAEGGTAPTSAPLPSGSPIRHSTAVMQDSPNLQLLPRSSIPINSSELLHPYSRGSVNDSPSRTVLV